MSLDTKWVNLLKTCLRQERNNPASKFFQLATLTTDDHPAVRTVVFRGWYDTASDESNGFSDSVALKIITDLRSEKIDALRRHPWAEICWYFVVSSTIMKLVMSFILSELEYLTYLDVNLFMFQKSRKQFRLTARNIRIVEASENDPGLAKARAEQWKALSDAARLQFRYPPPGIIRREVGAGEQDPFKPDNPSPHQPEDTFVLLLVEPHNVDMLDLRANERWMYTLQEDKSWVESFLNP